MQNLFLYLMNDLLEVLDDVSYRNKLCMSFQHDGARLHFSINVRQRLNQFFFFVGVVYRAGKLHSYCILQVLFERSPFMFVLFQYSASKY